ncbi:MAG: aminotransferase class III-fold pyridoxal phosphate-dependent enzyme [Desulfobacterales bacterium]|nr:aminotransferase class III-fold pyridoxal phosphate-dependent enzyme [Desulfobacterales bacterium]
MTPSDVIEKLYGFQNPDLEDLEGYASINIRVKTTDGNTYVWKQNPDSPLERAFLEAENQVLLTLDQALPYDFPVPQSVRQGSLLTVTENRTGNRTLHRLLTFVDGDFFDRIEPTPELFASLGTFLARLDRTLLDFRHPGIEARRLQWDLQHLDLPLHYLPYITDPRRRKLVEYFYLQFKEVVVPKLSLLRRSVIHGDANEQNLLTTGGQVSGIIDFGDMSYTPLVNEVAIALTYAMLGKADPLVWASHVLRAYTAELPLEREEVDLLYYLVAGRLCASVCSSAHAKTLKPDSAYITISEKPAWEMLEKWLTLNPRAATAAFARAAGLEKVIPPDMAQELARREAYFSRALSVSYAEPLKMEKAAFQYMYDAAGNTYLDLYNNIPHVGHCHPKVVQAGQDHMARLNTNTRYLYDQLHDYSERLLALFPASLNKIFYVNSGSAAADLAIRLARTHTANKDIVVLEHGYHGNTVTGIEISAYKFEHAGGPGQPDHILKAPIPDAYRGPYRGSGAGEKYAAQALALLKAGARAPAAFISEPIIGCGGQVPLSKGYLETLYPALRERGAVCISDEVQTGFGRLGQWFWGFEMLGVVPDIVMLGKPMGNGHPLAAVVTTAAIARSFENGLEFFSSFGGNSVACAVGLAVLEVLEEEALPQNAWKTGDYLKAGLNALKGQFPVIGDVRGEGLFLGIEFVEDPGTRAPHTALAGAVQNRLKADHVLVGTDGPFENVIKIKPPLCFDRKDADVFLQALEKALQEDA